MAEKKTEETKRLELQQIFERILGSRRVYFQPPPSLLMEYPCIKYNKSAVRLTMADDKIWNHRQAYSVTVMDYDPDSQIPFNILEEFGSLVRVEAFYSSSGINHTKLVLYY